jgi:hypothetical protein
MWDDPWKYLIPTTESSLMSKTQFALVNSDSNVTHQTVGSGAGLSSSSSSSASILKLNEPSSEEFISTNVLNESDKTEVTEDNNSNSDQVTQSEDTIATVRPEESTSFTAANDSSITQDGKDLLTLISS